MNWIHGVILLRALGVILLVLAVMIAVGEFLHRRRCRKVREQLERTRRVPRRTVYHTYPITYRSDFAPAGTRIVQDAEDDYLRRHVADRMNDPIIPPPWQGEGGRSGGGGATGSWDDVDKSTQPKWQEEIAALSLTPPMVESECHVPQGVSGLPSLCDVASAVDPTPDTTPTDTTSNGSDQ